MHPFGGGPSDRDEAAIEARGEAPLPIDEARANVSGIGTRDERRVVLDLLLAEETDRHRNERPDVSNGLIEATLHQQQPTVRDLAPESEPGAAQVTHHRSVTLREAPARARVCHTSCRAP